MKKIILPVFFVCYCLAGNAQFVARMEIKEPIAGVCDSKNVIVPFPMMKGQKEAECPLSDKEITKRLNSEVAFLKDHPGHEDKGMINMIIKCKGELVQCEIDNKTKDPELDKQIVAVFNSLKTWKPGKINGDKVDTSKLVSFEIKAGKISIE